MVPGALAKPQPSSGWASPISTATEVWALGWPAIVHLSLLTSVFVADRALVGQLGAGGLAAMHAATTLSWTVASVLGAVAIGALATVGAHAGAGRARAAADATVASLSLVTGLACATALVLWLGRDELLAALFPSLGAGHAEASRYLAILLPGLPIGLFATTAAACLHAQRDTRTPLVAALVGNGVNLVVSAHLVLGLWGLPALGVTGAAIGTVLAFVTQAVWLARRLRRRLARAEWDGARVRRLWEVTRPALGERVAYHAGYLVYAGIVGTLGPIAMAAHQGLLGIEAFSFTIAEGIGVAAAALAANHLGAGRHADAERTALVAIGMAALLLTGCALAFLSLGPPLIAWLGSQGEVAVELGACLPIAAVAQPFVAVAVVGCAALRGAGATRLAFGLTVTGAVVVRLSLAYLLARQGLAGAWWAAAADWLVQAALVVPLLLRRRRPPASR